jgi:hypothetical protein
VPYNYTTAACVAVTAHTPNTASQHARRAQLRRQGEVLAVQGIASLLEAPACRQAPRSLPSTCTTTPSSRVPGVSIVDPACGFTPVDGSSLYTGILQGSAYRMEVPKHWNGNLVMFAHGYAGTGTQVSVSNPQLREFYVGHGYAWAASSYRENGDNVGDGVQDTHDLMVHFSGITHRRAHLDRGT